MQILVTALAAAAAAAAASSLSASATSSGPAAAEVGAATLLPPLPPPQTNAQRVAMTRLADSAATASSAATPTLLRALAAPAFAANLTEVAPQLAHLTATELLQRWRAALEVTEIAHGFHARNDPTQNNALDLDVEIASSAAWFYNQWQLPVLFPQRESAAYYELMSFLGPAAAMEVNQYKLSPFTAPIPGRDPAAPALWPGHWPSDLDEASDRLVYAIFNQHQIDFPTWLWGDVAVVFNNSAVSDTLLLTPMDSGDYTCDCTSFSKQFCAGWSNQSACQHFWYCRYDTATGSCGPARTTPKPTCTVWDGMTPGVAGHSDHLLLPFARWASEAAPEEVDYARLALLFARQLQAWGSPGYPNMSVPAFDYYFEAQLLGNPRYDGAVKMVIADFAVNFGSDSGDEIKAWCAQRGWPLIWSSSTLPRNEPGSSPFQSHGPWAAQGRVLDAAVLNRSTAAHNLSAPINAALAGQSRLWAAVKAVREENGTSTARFLSWWAELARETPAALQPAPLMPHDCATPHECIGATADRACVCYDG